MRLTTAQLDRACGAVLATAVGDALGAPYEFGCASLGPDGPQMIGGGLGGFAPGEWTDDTSMAWAVLDVVATGVDLRSAEGLSAIARRFRDWYDSRPPDMGNQTRSVLSAAGTGPTGESMTAVARELHSRTGRTAGNGSLMRTAPVALAHLDDAQAVAEAARRVSALTHADPRAEEACVLWSLAIRHAILEGALDVRVGLAHLGENGRRYWTQRVDEAEASRPGRFRANGWAVTALQAAWSAIVHTPVPTSGPACVHLQDALGAAIAIGDDTDTVAAIAGGLLGARWGASAVPARWRRLSHGYPGLRGEQLVHLAHLATAGGSSGWPTLERIDYSRFGAVGTLVRHPFDDGVWLGDAGALDDLPEEVTAVVSLCRLGTGQVAGHVKHVTFRLVDRPEPDENPNLAFVLGDAARTVADLREEGHVVLVHCVAAHSRTPAVGIAYALRLGQSLGESCRALQRALPTSRPNSTFAKCLSRMSSDPPTEEPTGVSA